MSTDPRSVLARLAGSPGQASSLTPEDAALTSAYVLEVQAALAQRLSAAASETKPRESQITERLLSPADTAERLGVTLRWLYRNAKRLPFSRKLTNRTLRFHEQGLTEYIRKKRP